MTAGASNRILLTGATGYVGGRLRAALEAEGYALRCLARRPETLRGKTAASTEVAAGDLLEPASIERALEGMDSAVYLVHSMGSRGVFGEEETRSAINFVQAARKNRLQRILYLGGLGHDAALSPHLKSRQEVGRILRESGIPTLEFRASIIIGSGSLSFEMIRSLVDRLPVMTTPRWVRVQAQPIAIEDVIRYLVEACGRSFEASRIYEIGGPDRLSYLDLMREYARQRGLKRLILPVPVLTPGLSSLWLGLVTPLYARVGRKLIESIRYETVVRDDSALRDFDVRPISIREAIRRALQFEDRTFAATRWSDAVSSSYAGPIERSAAPKASRYSVTHEIMIDAPPQTVFETVSDLGGESGWCHADWLWKIRGCLDLLAGGIGMRRGRPGSGALRVGDAVDWWRVETVQPNKVLRFLAEMKLPGRGWLQFEIREDGGRTRLLQTALFEPRGFFGRLYWAALYPLHEYVFRGMLKGLARRAGVRSLRRR